MAESFLEGKISFLNASPSGTMHRGFDRHDDMIIATAQSSMLELLHQVRLETRELIKRPVEMSRELHIKE
jgi:hypothetical protein